MHILFDIILIACLLYVNDRGRVSAKSGYTNNLRRMLRRCLYSKFTQLRSSRTGGTGLFGRSRQLVWEGKETLHASEGK
jgi:hypothetical protein